MSDELKYSRRQVGLLLGASAIGIGMPAIVSAQTKLTLRLAHHLPTSSEQHAAAENFAKKVAAASNGNITIQILPAGQGGGQREIIESVSLGTLDMGYGESGLYANYLPEFSVLALAYLYRNFDQWQKVVDGDIGAGLAQALDKKANLKIMNWMVGGYRYSFLRNKPINVPDDFKGVKMRLPEAPVFVKTFAALGAIPTPIPAPEMYAALQTGVVDGMEGTAEVGYTFKIFQVTKFLTKTGHILMDGSFVTNSANFAKLSAADQKILSTAALETAAEQRVAHFDREKAWLAKLSDEGKMTINQPDPKPFIEKLTPLQNEFAAAVKGTAILEKIRAL